MEDNYGAANFGIRVGIDENYLEKWRGGIVRPDYGGAGKAKQ